ncbi:MAG TPA: archaemetzincin [Planctomycetota bacterium]|nr:archaemetzincin [Planctomycetota bacterium]
MKTSPIALLLAMTACRPDPEPKPAVAPDGFAFQAPPKPGEWLHHFKEEPQTADHYRASCANRRSKDRSVFYLQPLGDVGDRHGETLDRMRAYAEAFFGVPARRLDPIPLFPEAHQPSRDQHNASMIIARLADRVPADALVYAGITDADLFSPGLRFVFGQGSLQNRCGVYSLKRYATPDPALFLRRALKLMSHEAGHILSIGHCVFFRCVMQGANHLEEDDGHPMHLCPVDLEKLCWNTGVDPRARYERLGAFYRAAGLEAEAAWVDARLPK